MQRRRFARRGRFQKHVGGAQLAMLPVSREDSDMSDHTSRRMVGILAPYRVTFAKELLGLRFPIASMDVRHARDSARALRAAELRFTRHYGIDWRTRADVREVVRV